MSYLFDSNALIYSAEPGSSLQRLLTMPDMAISGISRVEVLGYPNLTPDAQQYFEIAFRLLEVVPVSEAVLKTATQLARTYRLKAADAVIAASTLLTNRTLLTADTHFQRVISLPIQNPLTI